MITLISSKNLGGYKIMKHTVVPTTLTYSWICIFWFSIIIWKSSRCTTHRTSDQFFKAARAFIFCWRTPRTSVAGYKIGIINLLCFLSTTCIDTMNIADSFQFVIRPCTTFVAPAIFLYTVKSRVLTRLVVKHMQAFSDCLWRGFAVLIYCDLLAKSWFPN